MPSQTNGIKNQTFNPDCHKITVYCKRLDRALDKVARNNALLFTTRRQDVIGVTIVRYSLPLISRVKHVDTKGHRFRVTGVGDSRYLPIDYGKVGSKGFSGVCWSLDIKFQQGCVTTTKYSDAYLYTYPRFEQYPLIDFANDAPPEPVVVDNVLLRQVGVFMNDFHPEIFKNYEFQYHEDIDSIPQLICNPRNSPSRLSQILKDHFNVIVQAGRESAVIKQLPSTK